MARPFTTLFMLMSVDGKISTGASDALLTLSSCEMLEGSYLRLRYRVANAR